LFRITNFKTIEDKATSGNSARLSALVEMEAPREENPTPTAPSPS
jgi:hypothetical protein